jgi:hypothetical protein
VTNIAVAIISTTTPDHARVRAAGTSLCLRMDSRAPSHVSVTPFSKSRETPRNLSQKHVPNKDRLRQGQVGSEGAGTGTAPLTALR